jgi:hypothetical protein
MNLIGMICKLLDKIHNICKGNIMLEFIGYVIQNVRDCLSYIKIIKKLYGN